MITGKHLLGTALLFSNLFTLHAQLKEGRIVYERKMNMHRHLADESMKSMIPEFSTSKVELLFTGDESIWRNVKEETDIRDQAGEDHIRTVINVNFGGVDDVIYMNYKDEKMVKQQEMGPKKYIIEDSFPHQVWKLESDTQSIAGHLCKKATTRGRDNAPIVAWYAEDIVSSSGPEVFGGLPGLILQLNSNDGEMIFTAKEIDTKGLDKSLVRTPTSGKKITRADFRKIMEEQFGSGGPGKPVIRIIRN